MNDHVSQSRSTVLLLPNAPCITERSNGMVTKRCTRGPWRTAIQSDRHLRISDCEQPYRHYADWKLAFADKYTARAGLVHQMYERQVIMQLRGCEALTVPFAIPIQTNYRAHT